MSDRRVQPIYDALDNGNNKQAIKDCDKVLKKHKGHPLISILKALALDRMGRHDEALALCDEVEKSNPDLAEDTTLSTMWMVYRANGKVSKGTAIYERAWKSDPRRDDFAQNCFSGYVREANYQKQQQIARKLFKDFGESKFFFWSVCSMATSTWDAGGSQDDMQLQLAEKMMQKALKEGTLKTSEELRLYVQILEQQGKLSEAVQLLAHPEGEAITGIMDVAEPSGWEMQQDLAQLHLKLEEYSAAQGIYETLLRGDHPDNWAFWLGFLDSVLEGSDATPDNVHAAIGLATELHRTNPRLRGPCLVSIEAATRRLAAGDDSALDSLCTDVVAYFRRFGTKSCCASDLRAQLQIVPMARRAALREAIGTATEEEGATAEQLSQLQRMITRHSLDRLLGLGLGMSVQDAQAKAVALCGEYEAALPLNEGMEPSERGHGDPLLLVAAAYLADAWKSHQDIGCALSAMAILDTGVTASAKNFEYKVVLMRLFRDIGAVSAAYDLYGLLDVKHVQYETLAHEMQVALVHGGLMKEAEALALGTLRFHTEAQREVPEYTAHAYRHENYSKVCEFVDFGKKLRNSVTCASAAARVVVWSHAFGGAEAEPPRMALERVASVDLTKLVSNEDQHCVQCLDALDEVAAADAHSPRWKTDVQQAVKDSAAANVHVARAVHALVGGDAATVVEAVEQLQESLSQGDQPMSAVQCAVLDAAKDLKGVLGGEGGIEAAQKLTVATGLLQSAKDRALAQLAAAGANATAAGESIAPLRVELAATMLQEVAPVILLIASMCFAALPAQKKGKKKPNKPLAPGVAEFRDAVNGLANAVVEASRVLSAEAEKLRKVLNSCGKSMTSGVSSVDAQKFQGIVKRTVQSQQATCTQLQATAKEIFEFVQRLK